jgi:hypothetical protein
MTDSPNRPRSWRPQLSPSLFIVGFVAFWLLIAGIATSGLSGFLIMASLIALLTAAYVLITGRTSWISIPNRKIGAFLLVGSLVGIGVGGAVASPRVVHEQDAGSDSRGFLGGADEATRTQSSPTETQDEKVAVETTATEKVENPVDFAATSINDPALTVGTSTVTTAGVPGVITTTYSVSYVDGVEKSRKKLSEVVSVAPVNQVTSVGVKPLPVVAPPPVAAGPSCDGNYADGCVPIASDVDCAGGSGNGPAYVSGVVRVVGSDIYGLDRDGNGYGCD